MKRYGGLWDELVSWENLVEAARKAQRGKRSRVAVQAFNFIQELHLLQLREQLQDGSYQPGRFRSRSIAYPKPRLISAAPYRDRVVHHALMNVLEPILDRHFHPDSYACRKGKGTHAAADRLQTLMRRNRYALQCDLQKFFPSINHKILKATFRRLIKDQQVLSLMDLIVDTSNRQPGGPEWFEGDDLLSPLEHRRGLPIGNLTSQWFANWMLNDLDHFVTSRLRIGAYVRYCDDFILLHHDRGMLKDAVIAVRDWLARFRMRLHENKVSVCPVSTGLTFVGYRIWPSHRLLRKENVRRFRRRVRWMRKGYTRRELEWDYIKPRLASWLAHAKHADSRRLVRRVSREWRFSRDGAKRESCYSRRQLEQQCIQRCLHEHQHQHALQSEQQHRVPSGPALSVSAPRRLAWNRTVYGSRERGLESPGPVPVLGSNDCFESGRIYAVRPGGAGRPGADAPIRRLLKTMRGTAI